MIRLATRDRRGPGQLAAVAVATAATVAVVVTVIVSLAMESNAVAAQAMSGLSRANLVAVVTGAPAAGQSAPVTATDIEAQLATTDGVSYASRDYSVLSAITTAGTTVPALVAVTPSEALAWSTLRDQSDRWPRTAAEVVLSQSVADKLGTKVGGTVTIAGSSAVLEVVGISTDPPTTRGGLVYVTLRWFAAVVGTDDPLGEYALILGAGADPAAVADAVRGAFSFGGYQVEVLSPAQATARAASEVGGDLTRWRDLGWLIIGLAAIVGAAWIATAFTLLLARRRRQFGMLRVVGATGRQLSRPVLAEAIRPGLLGSLVGVVVGVGVSWLAATLTGSIRWGIAVPWIPLAVTFVVGALFPVLIGYVPIRRATGQPPLTALGLAPNRRRWHVPFAAWVAAAAVAVGGIALLVVAFVIPSQDAALLWAIGAVALLIVAFLLASRSIVPALVRLAGGVVRRFGAADRLAVASLTHAPRRTTATATALALVVGLFVALQSGAVVVRQQLVEQAYEQGAVAIVVANAPADGAVVPISSGVRNRLAKMPGVTAPISLNGVAVADDGGTNWLLLGCTADAARIAANTTDVPTEGQVFVNPASWTGGDTITLNATTGPRAMSVVPSELAAPGQLLVMSVSLQQFGVPTQSAALWLAVPDHSTAGSLVSMTDDIVRDEPRLQVSGSVYTAGRALNIVSVLDGAAIGLGVAAVFIVLVGLGAVLRLGAVERRREFALLRMLGLRPGGLRTMLIAEALTVAGAAAVSGIVAGWLLAWVGTLAALQDAATIVPVVCANWPWTVGLLVLVVIAAVATAIGPGRRAGQVALVAGRGR